MYFLENFLYWFVVLLLVNRCDLIFCSIFEVKERVYSLYSVMIWIFYFLVEDMEKCFNSFCYIV